MQHGPARGGHWAGCCRQPCGPVLRRPFGLVVLLLQYGQPLAQGLGGKRQADRVGSGVGAWGAAEVQLHARRAGRELDAVYPPLRAALVRGDRRLRRQLGARGLLGEAVHGIAVVAGQAGRAGGRHGARGVVPLQPLPQNRNRMMTQMMIQQLFP